MIYLAINENCLSTTELTTSIMHRKDYFLFSGTSLGMIIHQIKKENHVFPTHILL